MIEALRRSGKDLRLSYREKLIGFVVIPLLTVGVFVGGGELLSRGGELLSRVRAQVQKEDPTQSYKMNDNLDPALYAGRGGQRYATHPQLIPTTGRN